MKKAKIILFDHFGEGRSIISEWLFGLGDRENVRTGMRETVEIACDSPGKIKLSYKGMEREVLSGQVVNFLISNYCFQVVFEPEKADRW